MVFLHICRNQFLKKCIDLYMRNLLLTLFMVLIPLVALIAQVGVGVAPSESSIVLFDGTEKTLVENWKYWEGPRLKAKMPIKWPMVKDPFDSGFVLNSNDPAAAGGIYGAADIVTIQEFKDFRLHVEFLIEDEGGNSGVYLQNRYEIQILDGDYGLHGMGAIINEHLPTSQQYRGIGKWNAYDIVFKAAQFSNGVLTHKARATIYFNGVKIHEDKEIDQVWGGPFSGLDGGNDGGKGITDRPGGIKLQAEGHQVLYRNIWIKELNLKNQSTNF
jgi:hypothetical protein